MKLSFSIPSKSKNKPKTSLKPQEEDGGGKDRSADDQSKQFVTEFDSSKPSGHNNRTLIIPPKENEWRPIKRMKNLDLPPLQSGDADIRFEVESLSVKGDEKMSYGLNLRENDEAEVKPPRTEDMLLEKLKYDLKRLPDDAGFEDFEDVPVEGFGAALLAGYGWHEGRGIGKNAKEDVKVKQYHKRTAKEGLGFVSNEEKIRKDKGPEKGRNRDRNSELKEDRKVDGDGFFVGKDVRVVGGTSIGSKGRIVERSDRESVVLRLARTEEELRVRVSNIADLGSKEEEKCLSKLKELKVVRQSNGKESDKTERSSERRESVKRDSRGSELKADLRRVEWLKRHIRVRIISKDLKGGKLYLKKGEVVDVVGPYKCDISMDESRELVQGVDQGFLETALPRRGGPVVVLYGKHQGVYGNLVDRDVDKEIGVVQDSDTHELVKVKFEQIAEYIGDPSYIGY